jgi:hypothetical protein
MAKKRVRKAAKRGFYGSALGESRSLVLEEACGVEGLDEEIALLRLRLRDLLTECPDKIELHLRTANAIAGMVKIRYAISKEQKKSLREAITRVITELAIPLGVKALIK